MTREEIKNIVNNVFHYYAMRSKYCIWKNMKKARDEIFKALEQEPILDKIRAEIEEYKSRQLTLAIGVNDLEEGKQIALEYVLAILDKYKAESEGEG